MFKRISFCLAVALLLGLSITSVQAQQRGGVLKFATPSVKPGLDPARTRTGDAYMIAA